MFLLEIAPLGCLPIASPLLGLVIVLVSRSERRLFLGLPIKQLPKFRSSQIHIVGFRPIVVVSVSPSLAAGMPLVEFLALGLVLRRQGGMLPPLLVREIGVNGAERARTLWARHAVGRHRSIWPCKLLHMPIAQHLPFMMLRRFQICVRCRAMLCFLLVVAHVPGVIDRAACAMVLDQPLLVVVMPRPQGGVLPFMLVGERFPLPGVVILESAKIGRMTFQIGFFDRHFCSPS
jgi:hypothetical protein